MSLKTDADEIQLNSNQESTEENIDKEFNIEILVKVVSSCFMKVFLFACKFINLLYFEEVF